MFSGFVHCTMCTMLGNDVQILFFDVIELSLNQRSCRGPKMRYRDFYDNGGFRDRGKY